MTRADLGRPIRTSSWILDSMNPLTLVQKWLGHAQLSTTTIDADAIGAEEQDIARRMWR